MTETNHFAANIEGAAPESPAAGAADVKLRFLAMPVRRLAVLLFFTAGIYQIYWFYRNWVLVRDATGRQIMPFWRAIFSIFFVWQLFRLIAETAGAVKGTRKFSGGAWAVFYIVFSLVATAISYIPDYHILIGVSFVVGTALLVLPFVAAQRTINNHTGKLPDKERITHHRTTKETILIVIGVILFLVAAPFYFSESLWEIDTDTTGQQAQADDLTRRYEECSASLKAREAAVDENSQASVDAYNSEAEACESLRLEQNAAVDELNRLNGN